MKQAGAHVTQTELNKVIWTITKFNNFKCASHFLEKKYKYIYTYSY
jgi:hypothetical protein